MLFTLYARLWRKHAHMSIHIFHAMHCTGIIDCAQVKTVSSAGRGRSCLEHTHTNTHFKKHKHRGQNRVFSWSWTNLPKVYTHLKNNSPRSKLYRGGSRREDRRTYTHAHMHIKNHTPTQVKTVPLPSRGLSCREHRHTYRHTHTHIKKKYSHSGQNCAFA
jgi:hypothetical protein